MFHYGAGDGGDLIVKGEHREVLLAVSAADLYHFFGVFSGESDQSLELLSDGPLVVVVEEQWHVPDGTHVAALPRSVKEAVISISQVASAKAEKQHPAVDKEAIRLQAETLCPGKKLEGDVSDVEGPDKESGAGRAPPAKETQPDPVEKPVDKS